MASDQLALIANPRINPTYCQYVPGPCDQDFGCALNSDGLFLYPNQPTQVATTIEGAVGELSKVAGEKKWKSWKALNVAGQIIFCEICKAIRFSQLVVADITTLNFNLLFEIGYALGLQVPVLPIRDTSNIRDSKDFKEIGILDTFGYFDYRNSSQLAEGVLSRVGTPPLTVQVPESDLPEVVQLLLWFGVLGVYLSEDEERYSYQFEHDPKLMTAGLRKFAYCIHPAFRPALGCVGA